MSLLFKIETKNIWEKAQENGCYSGSFDDQRDGFIHLSTASQLQETLTKHFSNGSDLVLIALCEQSIKENLKWEPARNGELFPHLYGCFPLNKVLWEKLIAKSFKGEHIVPIINHKPGN